MTSIDSAPLIESDREWCDAHVSDGRAVMWWLGSRGRGAWFIWSTDGRYRYRRLPSQGPTAYECGLVGMRWRRRFDRMSPETRKAVYLQRKGHEWRPCR